MTYLKNKTNETLEAIRSDSSDLLCRYITGLDVEIQSNALYYCNNNGMYIDGDGVGMQCNAHDGSKEYIEVMNVCHDIASSMRHLTRLLSDITT